MPIELNAIETRRFGITAAHVTDPDVRIDHIDQAAGRAGVQMLTARVNVSNLDYVHELERAGFQLMDTLVYWSCRLDGRAEGQAHETATTIRQAKADDAPDVAAISRLAFSGFIGHYHADPRLDNAQADEAYIEWAENSTRSCSEDAPVLLAFYGETLVGFLILRRACEEVFEIRLNGVDPRAKGRGVYSCLVREALVLAETQGAATIFTSTQINNYAPQKVWARFGFNHTSSVYTFHKWYDT